MSVGRFWTLKIGLWGWVLVGLVVARGLSGCGGMPATLEKEKETVADGSPDAPPSEPVGAEQPLPKQPPPIVELKASLKTLSCPDRLAELATLVFRGRPCAEEGARGSCGSSCLPSKQFETTNLPPAEIEEECKKASVLCVGPMRSVQSLDQVEKLVATDTAIDKILIEGGRYEGTLSLDLADRSLRIEGVSTEAESQGGVFLVAPKEDKPALEYGTLQVKSIGSLTIRRLTLQGGGHGLWVGQAKSLRIEDAIIEKNRLTGIAVEAAETVEILRSVIRENGGGWEIRKEGAPQPNLFGVLLGTVKVLTVESSEISKNAAGGLASGISLRAVGITNDHRVNRYEKYGVGITNDHRVALKGNVIAKNGPVSSNPGVTKSAGCAQACAGGGICEGGMCHSALVATAEGKTTVLGVGVYLAGAGQVSVLENTFLLNDTSALLVHSAKSVELQRNHVDQNGARPFAENAVLVGGHSPAVHLWHLTETVTVKHNVFVNNIDGLRVGQGVIERQEAGSARVAVEENAFRGQGRLVEFGESPIGIGVRLASEPGGKIGLDAVVARNYFAVNGLSGLAVTGFLRLEAKENHLSGQKHRGISLQDIESDRPVALTSNLIEGATCYGIQAADFSKTELVVAQNTIRQVQTFAGFEEADGINLTRLKDGQAQVKNNAIQDASRAGVFVDGATAFFEGNVFEKSGSDVATQNDAKAEGMAPGVMVRTNATAAPNKKYPLP